MKITPNSKNLAWVKKVTTLLAKTTYFSSLNKQWLSHVMASGATVRIKKGEVLIHQGQEEISTFYILLEGQLSVYRDKALITILVRPGQVVGEMSILTGHMRTAEVVGDKPSTLIRLSASLLQKPTEKNLNFNYKYLMILGRILSEKLAKTTEKAKLYEDALLEVKSGEEYSEQLKQEIRKKLEQIKLYSQVVGSNQDAIVICDEKGNIQEGNLSLSKLLGYIRSEFSDLNVSQLLEDLLDEKNFLTRRCTRGWKGERKAKHKDGHSFPAFVSISPIRVKEKTITSWAIEIRDIRLQKEYEELLLKKNVELRTTQQMLEETVQELEKSNQIKNLFFSNISSQLKTPLISISSFTDLLLQHYQVDEFYSYLKKICDEGKKLEKMVDNLLTMTETKESLTDLSLKVFRIEELLSYLTKRENIKLICQEPQSVFQKKTLLGDPIKLVKALEECIQYQETQTKNGEVACWLYYEYLKAEDAHAILLTPIEIEDPSELKSGSEEGSAEDSLPLAKRIIEVHKGELTLQSYQGKVVIRIVLPTEPERGLVRPPKILVVDESLEDRTLYRTSIQKAFEAPEIVELDKPIEALSAIHALNPDVIIVDPDFKEGPWSYTTFFQKVRASNTHQAKIFVISEMLNDSNKRKELLELEVNDYLAKPFSPDVFEFRLSRVLSLHQQESIWHKNMKQALQSSFTDGLTTLFNRRYYDKFIKEQLIKSKIQGIQCSVIVSDVDHFKHYNDTNGHQMGDVVLKQVAKMMKQSVRKSDMPARYGGEEFVMVLPSTSKNVALHLAEKMRSTIQSEHFQNEKAQPLGDVTVSCGVATYPEDGLTPKQLFQKADRALYRAKKKGRNCVVGAGE